ncbi:MAG: hypothetical protein J6O61_14395 [Butyrivibrio sp.]|uniref:hypothetical protein n=1 Tax=Butyrivibrio sp. TaxID=28121 RepID=UPI001B13284C|nr:hypothetical protein [Butyrivibrio sp.]MBO6241991.1 hypothetical protein [Butyrivibrio sp.]
MDELKIKIDLDPVTDGIIQFLGNYDKNTGFDIRDRKALVIGTDGNFRTISTAEMDHIFDGIGENGYAEPVGDDYLLCFSEKSVMDAEFTRYLVGSAVMVKVGRDSRIKPLSDIDIRLMRTYFQMGLITLTYGREKFDAYPLEYRDAA